MAVAPTDIRSLARSHTKLAIRTLAGIARSTKAVTASRVHAAVALLDRGWGKPTVFVEADVTDKRRRNIDDRELARRVALMLAKHDAIPDVAPLSEPESATKH